MVISKHRPLRAINISSFYIHNKGLSLIRILEMDQILNVKSQLKRTLNSIGLKLSGELINFIFYCKFWIYNNAN